MPHQFLPYLLATPFLVKHFRPTNNHLLFSMIHKSCIFPSIVFQFITFCNRWFSYLKQKPTSLSDECVGTCLRHFELKELHFVSQFKLFFLYTVPWVMQSGLMVFCLATVASGKAQPSRRANEESGTNAWQKLKSVQCNRHVLRLRGHFAMSEWMWKWKYMIFCHLIKSNATMISNDGWN